MINFFRGQSVKKTFSECFWRMGQPAALAFKAKTMINFFRRIRRKLADANPPSWRAGKPLKYMRYALGEIVLVVVGILIALYILMEDNINFNR